MLNNDVQITDLDLNAYVDNQLTDAQRSEVEAHLSRHPETAAQVMRDLALHRDLRRALAPPPIPRPLLGAARRLVLAQRRDARLRPILRAVPAVLLVGLGWLAHAGLGPLSISEGQASGPAPAMVTAALSAHEVSLLRAALASQPEITELDAEELRTATPRQIRRADKKVKTSWTKTTGKPSRGCLASCPRQAGPSLIATPKPRR